MLGVQDPASFKEAEDLVGALIEVRCALIRHVQPMIIILVVQPYDYDTMVTCAIQACEPVGGAEAEGDETTKIKTEDVENPNYPICLVRSISPLLNY